jgi:hypothetical protein
MGEPDYYAVLGIMPGSDNVVVQAAYKALMRKYHPDTNGDPDANARATAINAAYAVLGDADARTAYDARPASGEPKRNAAKPSAAEFSDPGPKENVDAPRTVSVVAPADWWKRAGMLVAAFIVFVFVKALFSAGGPYVAKEPANSDANAMVTEMNASDAMAGTTSDAMSNVSVAKGLGDNVAATEVISPLPTFQPPTPLAFEDIEAGARQFDKTLSTVGIAGAKAYSEKCHASAAVSNDWKKYDFCASFDLAGDYVDAAVAGSSGWQRSGYFQFIALNAADQYAAIASNSYAVGQRINSVRLTVGPVIKGFIEARIAKQRPAERDGAPEVDPADKG